MYMYTWAAFGTEFKNQLLNSRGLFSRKDRSTSTYAAHYAVYLAKISGRFLDCYGQTKQLNANNNHDTSMHGLHMHHTFLQPLFKVMCKSRMHKKYLWRQ